MLQMGQATKTMQDPYYINGINRPGMKEVYTRLQNAPRGSWYIVRAYTTSKEVEKQCTVEKARFPPPDECIAKDACFIVFKDSKTVKFYTNDVLTFLRYMYVDMEVNLPR